MSKKLWLQPLNKGALQAEIGTCGHGTGVLCHVWPKAFPECSLHRASTKEKFSLPSTWQKRSINMTLLFPTPTSICLPLSSLPVTAKTRGTQLKTQLTPLSYHRSKGPLPELHSRKTLLQQVCGKGLVPSKSSSPFPQHHHVPQHLKIMGEQLETDPVFSQSCNRNNGWCGRQLGTPWRLWFNSIAEHVLCDHGEWFKVFSPSPKL